MKKSDSKSGDAVITTIPGITKKKKMHWKGSTVKKKKGAGVGKNHSYAGR